MPHPLLRRSWFGLLAVVIVAACSGPIGETPRPTPQDFETLVGELTKAGVLVNEVRSGDPGCDDATLAGPAISFSAHGLDQPDPARIHLFIFRNGDAYERRRADVDTCVRAFIADPSRIEAVDASPFVALSEGPWGPRFREAIRAVLVAGAGAPAQTVLPTRGAPPGIASTPGGGGTISRSRRVLEGVSRTSGPAR